MPHKSEYSSGPCTRILAPRVRLRRPRCGSWTRGTFYDSERNEEESLQPVSAVRPAVLALVYLLEMPYSAIH